MKRRYAPLFVVLALAAALSPANAEIDPADDFRPTPGVACGPNDKPESIQGRVPLADFQSGRAAQGYTCNSEKVGQVGSDADSPNAGALGGYRVYRYVDEAGHVCAFYDTTLLFPANVYASGGDSGVWVLDMTDPAHPVHTATLSTPAMQSPNRSA
jgi:hypothetical protein